MRDFSQESDEDHNRAFAEVDAPKGSSTIRVSGWINWRPGPCRRPPWSIRSRGWHWPLCPRLPEYDETYLWG